MGGVHVCTPMDSSAPPPDGAAVLEAMARRFDETMGRAHARVAAMNRTSDELAGREDASERRRRMLDDLALEPGG
jgi:hypothetical protein